MSGQQSQVDPSTQPIQPLPVQPQPVQPQPVQPQPVQPQPVLTVPVVQVNTFLTNLGATSLVTAPVKLPPRMPAPMKPQPTASPPRVMAKRQGKATVSVLKKDREEEPFDPGPLTATLSTFTGDAKQVAGLKAGYENAQKHAAIGDNPDAERLREAVRAKLCETPEQLQKVAAADPEFAGKVLSAVDPALLKQVLGKKSLKDVLGPAHDATVVTALEKISGRKSLPASGSSKPVDRDERFDRESFDLFAGSADLKLWNDEDKSLAKQSRGLGAKVNNHLWNSGNYDVLCDVIKKGVDTTIPFKRPGGGDQEGCWSGFIQPIEHVLGNYIKEAGQPPSGKKDDPRAAKVDGARMVLKALEDRKTPKPSVLTNWKDVQDSDLAGAFTGKFPDKKPGTIWGFEDVRLPYVQAAHDTAQGDQPLRMMELWTAVLEGAGSAENYEKLVADPKGAAAKFAAEGEKKLRAALKEAQEGKELKDRKLNFIKEMKKPEDFINNFTVAATSFLEDFATQMPKVQFDTASKAGIDPSPQGGGIACKAGLWWAKNNKQPVYYCLDGVKMEDVTNYKIVKNKAIEEFLLGQKPDGQDAKMHHEVITLVELREVMKNWGQLGGTVVFVQKGKFLTKEEAEALVKDAKQKMEEANKTAGKAVAPPKQQFKDHLEKLEPGLFDQMKSDADARDVVRKAGYVAKMANTKWQIALDYISKKSEILFTYKLIPQGLPAAAAKFRNAVLADKKVPEDITKSKAELEQVFTGWKGPKALRDALEQALLLKPAALI